MDGLDDSVSFQSDWRGRPALSATDRRWALVSTSLTAVIAGSVAWLAMGTMPPANSVGFETPRHGFAPYALFQQLLNTAEKSSVQAPVATPAPVETAKAPAQPTVETRSVTLESGDTLAGAIEDAGVSSSDAGAAVAALTKVYDPRSLKAGQSFDLTITTPPASGGATPDAQLTSVEFSPSIEHDVTIARGADGNYTANDAVKQLVMQTHRAGATIDSSLYLSAMQAGIPADVVVDMIHIFSYKVDFQRDIRPGDSFEVYYSYYDTPDGQPAKEGVITYAQMKLGDRTISLYRYQPDPNESADYFDAKGQSAKGMLMKTPVDGARITSGFGMREHPILGYTRMHQGVDFGVPIGTPVMAAGAGTIERMAWDPHGYGNWIELNNGNGYETIYGHLSHFAAGLHVGSHVHQAQVIALSGMTGLATGPHLHYGLKFDGHFVNPLKVKIADGRKLSGKELRAFESTRMKIDADLVATKLVTRVADSSNGLRKDK